MSKERIIALYSKLDKFVVGEKTSVGTVHAINVNKQTGALIVEYFENVNNPGDKDVVRRYTIIPRDQITRIDGEHVDGPTLVTPTGLEI